MNQSFKAMGAPTRMETIELLRKREMNAGKRWALSLWSMLVLLVLFK